MSRLLSEKTGLTWINVSEFAIENKCLEEYDEIYQCPILDADKVIAVIDIYFRIFINL